MPDPADIVITGAGALCAAGKQPGEIWDAVRAGRSALSAIQQWDSSEWPRRIAGEIADLDPVALLRDRKIQKLIRRSDVFGLYAADQAIEASRLTAHRDALGETAAAEFSDRTGVYVGSGGGSYSSQYDYFPLLTSAAGDLQAFGRELGDTVNPMWLLRTLPNNVLCHVGIRHGLKGPNACITNHSVSGMLAIVEAMQAVRHGEADRAVAVGHDAPVEPQAVLYFSELGLLARDTIRSFDAHRDGSLFGEGAGRPGAGDRARGRAARSGSPGRGARERLRQRLAGPAGHRRRGRGLGRRHPRSRSTMRGCVPTDVGMIVAHANGTRQSDASEAAALMRVFRREPPPVTGFKWAFGHLIAASGIIETVAALSALRAGSSPASRRCVSWTPLSRPAGVGRTATPRTDVALVISRGFGGTNAALLVRAAAVTRGRDLVCCNGRRATENAESIKPTIDHGASSGLPPAASRRDAPAHHQPFLCVLCGRFSRPR